MWYLPEKDLNTSAIVVRHENKRNTGAFSQCSGFHHLQSRTEGEVGRYVLEGVMWRGEGGLDFSRCHEIVWIGEQVDHRHGWE